MNETSLKTKPALKTVVLFILGLVFAAYIKIPVITLFIITGLFFIISFGLLCVIRNRTKLLDYLLGLMIFLAAILRYQIASDIFPKHHIINFTGTKKKVTIKGYIVNSPVKRDNSISCEISTEYIQTRDSVFNTCGKILLKWNEPTFNLKNRDQIVFTGKLRKPRGERNPGEFNYNKYLRAKGIFGIVYLHKSSAIKLLPTKKKQWLINKVILSSREYMEQTIDKAFHGQTRTLLKGLILGERAEISMEIKEAFSKAGVMHILAVSGLHVGFMVLIFSTLFKILRIPYRITIYLTMLSILFYMFIVGLKPPVVRASIIVILYFWSLITQRKSNPLNLLAAAALIILIINPLQLFQPSFQLSFVAFLSIIYLYEKLKNSFVKLTLVNRLTKSKLGNYLLQLFLVSLAVSLGTFPLIVYYFERLTLVAIIINIVVVPLAGLIIALGFSFISLSPFLWPVAKLLANINILLLNYLINLVIKIAELPFSYIPIYRMNLIHILLIYLILLLIFHINNRRCQKAFVFLLLFGLNVIVWRSIANSTPWMEVIFLDVGQGDAALIKFPNDDWILIDGGTSYKNFNSGERHILPLLQRKGVRRLKSIILSHEDNDHIGGIPYILRNFSVERVIDNGVEAKSEVFNTYKFIIDSLQIKHEIVKAGTHISELKNYGIFVLHPGSKDMFDNYNNFSLVLKIIYGNISFLFTGDIERQAEKQLVRFDNLLKCDVLKIAHHGSSTSSTTKFLELVNPRYAVISVGERNKFNFPSKIVLKRLTELGIKIIRTDINGAVIFRTNGKRLERTR